MARVQDALRRLVPRVTIARGLVVGGVILFGYAGGWLSNGGTREPGQIAPTVAQSNYLAVQANFRNGYLYRLSQTPAYTAWKQANPGEYAAIVAQLRNPGGPAAVVQSPFGIQLASVVQMYGYVYGGAMALP